jgi:CubicO group peptidase (beta-lactamase class C family)
MKFRLRPPAITLFSILALVIVFFLFGGINNLCACNHEPPAVLAAGDGTSAPDLGPDTVLLKIQLDENKPPLELTLKQLMDTYKVPGLSVAVVDNYQIVWAKGFGVTEYGGSTPVTTRTLFQAGSISKPAAAVGAMWLVEHGKLSLDEDVNKKLKTWKVPENEFTKDQKVTLRRLMSHSAGLTVHGFPGYAVSEPKPTLVEIFNGEKPANTAPIRVDFVPGTKMRYSGGGVTIEQQLMMDVTGKPFPEFMQQTVLSKIGMTDSSYEQPLPATRAAQTATGTYGDGMPVQGRWHIYPEMAAAGLWTTPTDLAKFGIEIALSNQGKANHVLTQKSVREMLTPFVAAEGGGDEHVGLAFFLEDKMPGEFGHNGSDEGFQALLTMNSETGRGIAIMGNSDAFFFVAPHVEEAIRRARGWKTVDRPHSANEAIMLLYHLNGTQGAMDAYDRFKKGIPGYDKPNEGTLNGLGYMMLRAKKTDEAIKIFQRNVEDYPNAWNPYDSLAEAYMVAGQKELAIKNYEKSLQLNPQNTNGAEMLKKLKGQ